eukprot:2341696-Lingulodinium_polyedra.AAC.1
MPPASVAVTKATQSGSKRWGRRGRAAVLRKRATTPLRMPRSSTFGAEARRARMLAVPVTSGG